MKVGSCFVLCSIVLNAVAEQTNSESEASGLALEPEEPTTTKDNNDINIKLINVEKFIGEAKTVLDKAKKVIVRNQNFRRDFSYDRLGKFTDFIRHVIRILKKYEDGDLKRFFAIIDDEIRKYHYRGCKFHELIDNDSLRRFMGQKLDTIKTMTAADIRKVLKIIADKLEEANYDKNEKEFVDFINSLYRKDSVENFNKVLINIDDYRLKSRRNMDLVNIVKDGVRSVIFDHYTELNHNARLALKSKVNEFWGYIMGVSASLAMKHYLNKLKLSDTMNMFRYHKNVNTTVDTTTLRQMYVEENLDLKYDPHAYDHVTKMFRSKTKRGLNSSHFLDKVIKATEKATLRQINLEKENFIHAPRGKNLHKDKRSGKHKPDKQHLRNKKFVPKTTEETITHRQIYFESIDLKHDTKSDTHADELKDNSTPHVSKLKSINKKHNLDLERTSKTTSKATLKQVSTESDDSKYDSQSDTDSTESSNKDTQVDSKNADKTLNKAQIPRLIKTTEATTMRQMYVEIMDLKYGPDNNTPITESVTKEEEITHRKPKKVHIEPKNTLSKNKIKIPPKIARNNRKTNMYIDVDSRLIKQSNFKYKPIKNARKLRRLERGKKHWIVLKSDKDIRGREQDQVVKRQFSYATKRGSQWVIDDRPKDIRSDKRHTSSKPTAVEILEEHSAIINVKTAKTHKPKRLLEDYKIMHQDLYKRGISTLISDRQRMNSHINKKFLMSAKAPKKAKYIPATATNHRIISTTDAVVSEEGLSIEDFKHSNRRMDNDIPADTPTNDTAVLTKIKELENELSVVKTKLQNDTEIIENLNNKICETETKLKEFCNQEFKIVVTNKNTSSKPVLRLDPHLYDKGKQEDTSTEFRNNSPTRFQVKRNMERKDEDNSISQKDIDSNTNKVEAVNEEDYKDINSNTHVERSKDGASNNDKINKITNTGYDTDTKTKDMDKNTAFNAKTDGNSIKLDRLSEPSLNNKNYIKNLEKKIALNKPFIEKPKEGRVVSTTNDIADVNNVPQKINADKNKIKKFKGVQTDKTIQRVNTEVNNIKTYKQNMILPKDNNIVQDQPTESDTSDDNYVQAINKNDYSDEYESNNEVRDKIGSIKKDMNMELKLNTVPAFKNLNHVQNKHVISEAQFKTGDKIITKATAPSTANPITKADFKPKLDLVSQPSLKQVKTLQQDTKTSINNQEPANVIDKATTQQEYDDNALKMLEGTGMLAETFDKDGVFVDNEKLNEVEVLDKTVTVDNAIEEWLNVTGSAASVTSEAPEEDNLFRDVDDVLGRLAKEKNDLAS